MMNLTTFAPDDFKEHLRALDNKGKFNRARIYCELGATTNHQHYVITGNDGVGKEDAVKEIFNRVASVAELERLQRFRKTISYCISNMLSSWLQEAM